MSNQGYSYGHGSQPGESSRQAPATVSDLFGPMSNLSLGSDLQWFYEAAQGYPIATVAGNKGIYNSLVDTSGTLEEVSDNVEDMDSRELESKIAEHTNGQQVNGWSRIYWNNYKLMGTLRNSRRGEFIFNPTHLRYAISKSREVYSIKKANICDKYEAVVYPFALSNLVGMICRRHQVTEIKLKHLIFYNVTNPEAWTAMEMAFDVAGVVLPEYPQKTIFEEEESLRTSSRRMASSSRGQRSGPPAKTHHRLRPAFIEITANNAPRVWDALHTNNPFTKTVNYLCRDEFGNTLTVVGYTLIAVAQERSVGPQTYWNALVAHFAPTNSGKATGKGKGVQGDTSAQRYGGRAY